MSLEDLYLGWLKQSRKKPKAVSLEQILGFYSEYRDKHGTCLGMQVCDYQGKEIYYCGLSAKYGKKVKCEYLSSVTVKKKNLDYKLCIYTPK